MRDFTNVNVPPPPRARSRALAPLSVCPRAPPPALPSCSPPSGAVRVRFSLAFPVVCSAFGAPPAWVGGGLRGVCPCGVGFFSAPRSARVLIAPRVSDPLKGCML